MKKSRTLLSLAIVSLEEGQRVGFVRHLVVDPQTLEVAALVVSDKGLFKGQKIIPFAKVAMIGDDAITVDRSASAEKAANLPQIMKLIKEDINLLGTMVVGENGKEMGQVAEFLVDPETGKITSLELSGKYIDCLFRGKVTLSVSEIRTVGRDAIIVRKGAETKMSRIEGNWRETWSNLKSSTRGFWNNTVRRGRDLPQAAAPTDNSPPAPEEPIPAEANTPASPPAGPATAGPAGEEHPPGP